MEKKERYGPVSGQRVRRLEPLEDGRQEGQRRRQRRQQRQAAQRRVDDVVVGLAGQQVRLAERLLARQVGARAPLPTTAAADADATDAADAADVAARCSHRMRRWTLKKNN